MALRQGTDFISHRLRVPTGPAQAWDGDDEAGSPASSQAPRWTGGSSVLVKMGGLGNWWDALFCVGMLPGRVTRSETI